MRDAKQVNAPSKDSACERRWKNRMPWHLTFKSRWAVPYHLTAIQPHDNTDTAEPLGS